MARPTTAVIVGAGIGGLACAAALVSHGWQVELVEQQDQLAATGAGIVLQPNARRVLQAIDAEPAGRPFSAFWLADATGRVRVRSAVGPSLAVTRSDLHAALAHRTEGLPLHLGTTARAIPGGVELDDGTRLLADHVIAADGLGSGLRTQLVPEIRRIYAGYTCLRALLDRPAPYPEPVECWGRGARVGIVPLVQGTYVYVTYDAPPRAPRKRDALHPLLAQFHGPPAAVLRALPPDPLHHDIDELDRHVFQRDGVWFLGDAAHGFTPNLGQGAAQALEDALILADGLACGRADYPRQRRGPVGRVAFMSRWMGRLGQLQGPLAAPRDALMRAMPQQLQPVG